MTLIISLGSIYDRELRKFSSASQIEHESVAPVLANEKYANQFYLKKSHNPRKGIWSYVCAWHGRHSPQI
jgi:hypothetical protein